MLYDFDVAIIIGWILILEYTHHVFLLHRSGLAWLCTINRCMFRVNELLLLFPMTVDERLATHIFVGFESDIAGSAPDIFFSELNVPCEMPKEMAVEAVYSHSLATNPSLTHASVLHHHHRRHQRNSMELKTAEANGYCNNPYSKRGIMTADCQIPIPRG